MIWRPERRIVARLAAARRIDPPGAGTRRRPQCFARSSLSRCSWLRCRWPMPRAARRRSPSIRLPPERSGRPLLPTCHPATTLGSCGRSRTISMRRKPSIGAARHALGPFEKIREIGFRANGLAYIPRRYCVARVIVGDPLVPAPAAPRSPSAEHRRLFHRGGRRLHRLRLGRRMVRRRVRPRACLCAGLPASCCRSSSAGSVERPLPVEYGLKARY